LQTIFDGFYLYRLNAAGEGSQCKDHNADLVSTDAATFWLRHLPT